MTCLTVATLTALAAFASPASAATTRTVCASGCDFTTIQAAVNASVDGDTVDVQPGTYHEDVAVNKAVTLHGAGTGAGGSTVSGPIGGTGSSTFQVQVEGVVIEGFVITRDNPATFDNADGANLAGVAVQGQSASAEVRNSKFVGNRTAIDVNNSDGNSIHNNVIDDNRTGLVFRNQTDSTTVTENSITNNWTVGVLFIDASGGGSPQRAANSNFVGNDISGNWYGGVVDRQNGADAPAIGSVAKNFSANWFGKQAPTVTTANSVEPGYTAVVPPAYGGTSQRPVAAQPDIAGPASANIDYTPLLRSGTDTASATLGFQGDFSDLTVTAAGNQSGSTGRIQEGIDRAVAPGTVHILGGTFAEAVNLNKAVDLVGTGLATVIDPPIASVPALSITASGTALHKLTVSSLRTTGATGGGVSGSGIGITAPVSQVKIANVRSDTNSGHGLAVNTSGALADIELDSVSFNSNSGDGIRFPSSMASLTGLTIDGSHFDDNGFAGLEIIGGTGAFGPVSDVTVTDSTFSRNVNKGMYIERLSDADFDGITVDESGYSGGFAAGIDLNLKGDVFSGITIENSDITDSGTGDATNGVGLAIKARSDAPSYSGDPATLTDVTVTGNHITGNQNGIRLGEPGKSNPGPTDVHVNRNEITGNVVLGVDNASTASADAECNWWGAANGPGPVGPGSGDKVSTGVDFDPWLLTSDLEGSCHTPVAANDTGSTNEDTTLNVPAPGVLVNDTTDGGDPPTAILVTDVTHGDLTLNSNGSYTYAPDANYNGPDSFTYKVSDGARESAPATVSLTVTPVNDAPVAVADSGTVAEDGTLVKDAASGVLANDSDTEGQSLTATKASDPLHGSVTLGSDGSYTYTPTANYNGPDSFTYKANDGTDDSNVATVTITVTSVNDAPVANADSGTAAEDGTLTKNAAAGVLSNDTDVEGQTLTAQKVTDPSHGSVTLGSDGSYTYTPTANYNGPDSFTYKANDGSADSNTATVTLTVTSVNDAPVAVDDSGTVAEDGTLTKNAATGVLSNDTDTENQTLSATKVAGPSHGTATVNSDGSYTYTPTANYNGPDSFTYKANDGTDDSNVATVTITVTSVNDAPVAGDDSKTVAEDSGSTSTSAPGLLGHVTDAEGDSLTASKVAGPSHGTATVNSNGSWSYTPDANYHGPDSFTYKANDGTVDSNVATVTITVTSVNDAPVAVDDAATVPEDGTLTRDAASGVLANDTDADGDSLTATKLSDPSHGTATVNPDGSYTYHPVSNFTGEDSFSYKANDGTVDSNIATVTITVGGGNDAPVAANDTGSVTEDGTLTVPASGVLANDTDADGDPLTAAKVADPAHGTVALAASGGYTYTPAANFSGTDSFTYKANDGNSDSNVATVTITVNGVNDAPVAVDDSATTNEGETLVVPAPGVRGNDTDADGDALTAGLVSNVAHGTVSLNADGGYSYVPAAGFSGNDSFTYRANDGNANSNVATVTIAVADVAGGGDETAPVISAARLTKKKFKSGKGTRVQYKLSEDARVRFTVRKRSGKRLGSFAQNGKKGTNRKRFTGKIRGKALKAGRYRLVLKATDAAGNVSKTKRLSFRVKP